MVIDRSGKNRKQKKQVKGDTSPPLKKFSVQDFKVSRADKAANPGKTSLQIVNARTGARNPDSKPSRLVKSGSSRKVGSSPTKPITSFTRTTSKQGTQPLASRGVSGPSNAGIATINQAQGNPQFQQEIQQTSTDQYFTREAREFAPSDRNREQASLHRIEEQAAMRQQGPTSGFQNASNVLLSALNPWSNDKIVATSNNAALNAGLELVANNPYTTALVATGVYGLIKGGIALGSSIVARRTALTAARAHITQLSENAIVTASKQVAVNSATSTSIKGLMSTSGFKVGAILMSVGGVVGAGIGSEAFTIFQIAESMDKTGFAKTKMRELGRLDLVKDIDDLEEEILYPEGWKALLRKLPFVNAVSGTAANVRAAAGVREAWNALGQDLIIKDQLGETNEQTQSRIQDQETDMYEQNRLKRIEQERLADEAAIARRNEDAFNDAEFRTKERERIRKEEEEDRKAIADFWIQYREKLAMMEQESRPVNGIDYKPKVPTGHEENRQSNLGFGIV